MNVFSNGINYADGDAPIIMSDPTEALGYDGWYYKNRARGNKINWYIPVESGLRITDLKMIHCSLKLINPVSSPFITIYTKPTGRGDAAIWYHSRVTYNVPPGSLVAGRQYCFWAEIGAVSPAPTVAAHTNLKLIVDTVSTRGYLSQTDQILFIAFSSNSSTAAGNVEFILKNISLVKATGSIDYLLSNDELFTSMNMDFNAMTVSTSDTRLPGNMPPFVAHAPANCVTKATKIGGQKVKIGHNALANDAIIDNLKMPRLGNVAGKSASSVADDNQATIFNNFFLSVDFTVLTTTVGASCNIEAWGQDQTTLTKIYANQNGEIKVQYSGVDLISKGFVNAGDEIVNGQTTAYGWTTREYAGSLVMGKWYRLTQVVHFSEELYSDMVQTRLYELSSEDGTESLLWDIVDNTWEAYYVLDPEQAINGNLAPSIDCVQFQCRGSPVNVDVLTVKNVIYSSSRTVPVTSLGRLRTNVKGVVTYFGGNLDPETTVVQDGARYAFLATGGFQIERGFDTIRAHQQTQIGRYDMTDAVQVMFDVRTFNAKLGLIKDASNATTSFNTVTDTFGVDSITLTASEFVAGLSAENVLSVGKYSTMYSDFVSYVRTYFGYNGGFSSLFNAASEFEINGGVFDVNAFMNLMTGSERTETGAYVRDLSGSIVVNDVNRLLRYAVDGNVFGNRLPTGGVADGFVSGDIIWIPEGTVIKLNLDIDAESFQPVNNEGPINVSQETNVDNGNFKTNTSATTTNICRVLTAPLMIKLV